MLNILRPMIGPAVAVAIVGMMSSAPFSLQHQPLHIRRTSATIRGTVMFVHGGLPNSAMITLIDRTGQSKRTTEADADGNYIFRAVPPGLYVLSAFGGTGNAAGSFVAEDITIASHSSSQIIINIVFAPLPWDE